MAGSDLLLLICQYDMFTLFFILTAGGEGNVANFCWVGATGGSLNRMNLAISHFIMLNGDKSLKVLWKIKFCWLCGWSTGWG